MDAKGGQGSAIAPLIQAEPFTPDAALDMVNQDSRNSATQIGCCSDM